MWGGSCERGGLDRKPVARGEGTRLLPAGVLRGLSGGSPSRRETARRRSRHRGSRDPPVETLHRRRGGVYGEDERAPSRISSTLTHCSLRVLESHRETQKMSSTEGAESMSAADCKAKGNEFLKAKDYPAAIAWYTKAIEKDPSGHVYYSNRSAAHLANGDPDRPLEDGTACIKAKPDWPKGYNRKGCALHALKKYDEAIATFEEGLKIAPGSALLTGPRKRLLRRVTLLHPALQVACPDRCPTRLGLTCGRSCSRTRRPPSG